MKKNNWKTVPFGFLCETIQPGFASGKHTSDGKGIPHLRPMNVDRNGRINLEVIKCVQEHGTEPLKAGDILFNNTNSRELVGKTGLIKTDTDFAFSNHMTRIRLQNKFGNPQFYSTYLHYLFQMGFFKERCSNHVNQSSIGKSFLEKEIEAPLPPLAEQHRIVAKIEELFSDLDSGIASLKEAREKLKTYRYSSLRQILEGENTAPEIPRDEWKTSCLGEIFESLRNGLPEKPNGEGGTRIFRISALRPNKIEVDDVRYFSVPPRNYQDYFLDTGDLLFTRYNGNSHLVGVCAVVPKLPHPTLHPDKLIRAKVKTGINPKYIAYSANFGITRRHIEERTRTTAGQAGISGSDIKTAPILVPPIAIQNKIVSEIESRLSEADNLEKTLDAALAQSESLRQSILKQAFAGKLVPQDPNDESAEKLLERIRAERAAREETPKKRGRYGGGDPSGTRSVAAKNGTPVEGGAPKTRRGRPPGKKATAASRRG